MAIASTDHRIPSGRPGLDLALRNKRLNGPPAEPRGTPVLCVHGATYGATMTFDYPVAGRSWMDALAAAGFDAWCLDLLGYGASDRPPQMREPASASPPLVDTAEAEADLGRAVRAVLDRTGAERLVLIGYSWGTAITGGFAARSPELVERLVLYGATWLKDEPSGIAREGIPGAYRSVTAEAIARRWLSGLSAEQAAAVATPAHIAAWAAELLARDPLAALDEPPRLRAPAGSVKDSLERWTADAPTYDPGAIQAPTLVVVGEWDQDTTPARGAAVFERLTGTAVRRYVIIGGATHTMLLERQHGALRATVEAFLREPLPLPPPP